MSPVSLPRDPAVAYLRLVRCMATYHVHRSVFASIFSSTVIAACASVSFATQPPVLTQEQAAGLVVFAPKPEYPQAARRQRLCGKGVFLLNVNAKTGQVTSIKIERRTGHQVLDVAALKTLINWRFKPHSVTKVRIPVIFVDGVNSIRTTVLKDMFPDI
jgi:TonB family protein